MIISDQLSHLNSTQLLLNDVQNHLNGIKQQLFCDVTLNSTDIFIVDAALQVRALHDEQQAILKSLVESDRTSL